jgi:hypothetical protein
MKVFRQFKTTMGKAKLADILYAVIMCRARISSTFGVGIYKYTRIQNCFNSVDIMIEIEESEVDKFASLANVFLSVPQEAQSNALSATTPEDKNDKG